MKPGKPTVYSPVVNSLKGMNGLQRATESFRYSLLNFEHWVSPQGHIREWVRRNALLGMFLLIPAVLVMPIIGLMLWQVDGWTTLVFSIVATLTTHPVQTLLVFIVLRIVMASMRR
jgi:hypothetical protein